MKKRFSLTLKSVVSFLVLGILFGILVSEPVSAASIWRCTACGCLCNTTVPDAGELTYRYGEDSIDPEGVCVTACRTACGETLVLVPLRSEPTRNVEITSGVPEGNFQGRGITCTVVGNTEAPASTEPATVPEEPVAQPIRLFNPLGSDLTIPEFIGRGVKAVTGVVGAIALLMFVYGGIIWMTAGSSDRVEMAKNILKNSLIGLLLIFLSYSLISVFFGLFS